MRVCTAHRWPHQGIQSDSEHLLCPRSAAHPLPWQQLHGCTRAPVSGGSRLASLQAVASQQSSDAALEAATAAELATVGSVSADSLVEVGILHGPHGVRGEIKVQPLTDFPEERLGSAGIRWLQPQQRGKRRPSSALMPLHLDRGRYMVSKGREVWVVKFQGVDTPEAAQALGGQVLLAMPEEHGDLEEDEFYVQDLIGLDVYLEQTQEHLGQVVDHYSGTGDHDVLRIELDERHGQSRNGQLCSMLLPFTKEFAPDVDMEERKLSVCPPEGLLQLALSPPGSNKRSESGDQDKTSQFIVDFDDESDEEDSAPA